jgi:hypothetical protein
MFVAFVLEASRLVIDAIDFVAAPSVSVTPTEEIISRCENSPPARPYLSKGER